jgi:hypothetical protein
LGKASHDLEMIVKVMFACLHPAYFDRCFPKLHKESSAKDFEVAIARWKTVRQLAHWKLFFDASERTDYAALQSLIMDYIPLVLPDPPVGAVATAALPIVTQAAPTASPPSALAGTIPTLPAAADTGSIPRRGRKGGGGS